MTATNASISKVATNVRSLDGKRGTFPASSICTPHGQYHWYLFGRQGSKLPIDDSNTDYIGGSGIMTRWVAGIMTNLVAKGLSETNWHSALPLRITFGSHDVYDHRSKARCHILFPAAARCLSWL